MTKKTKVIPKRSRRCDMLIMSVFEQVDVKSFTKDLFDVLRKHNIKRFAVKSIRSIGSKNYCMFGGYAIGSVK
jgi:hypothetical protein